jgi:hypothetical protein
VASYKINPDGSHTEVHKFMRLGVLTFNEIFPETPETAKKFIKRKPKSKGALQHKYVVHSNADLVRKIFSVFLMKVLIRVIDGDLFMFPGITKAHLVAKAARKECVQGLHSHGCLKDYDLVKAGYKVPNICLDFGPFSRRKDFQLYIPKYLRQRMLKNAENGQIPWITINKTISRDVQYEECDDGDL